MRLLAPAMSAFRILPLLLLAALPAVAAKAPSESSLSGTYRGRVLTERFRHEQALSRRRAALRAEQVAPPRQDQGEIAVMEASDFIIAPLNLFDLQGITLRFTPSASGYASAPEALAFDESARANGVSLALDDDDTTRVDLEFSFPYFGSQYSAVWVNSDGNLTFGEGDGLVAARSVARAVAGPPRIAPLFADLDPSRPAARVRVDSRVDRVFVTWDGVPQYTDAGNGRRQIFQVELSADGGIAFHYLSATLNEVTTGVFPGRLAGQRTQSTFPRGRRGRLRAGSPSCSSWFPISTSTPSLSSSTARTTTSTTSSSSTHLDSAQGHRLCLRGQRTQRSAWHRRSAQLGTRFRLRRGFRSPQALGELFEHGPAVELSQRPDHGDPAHRRELHAIGHGTGSRPPLGRLPRIHQSSHRPALDEPPGPRRRPLELLFQLAGLGTQRATRSSTMAKPLRRASRPLTR
ncbi:MAG: hypothetical protein R2724_03340 [Bryobacterales bacterium]